jgi:hypothetical protein
MAVSFVRSFLRLAPLSRFRPTSRMLLAYLACVLTAHVAFGAGESRLYRVPSMSSPVYVESRLCRVPSMSRGLGLELAGRWRTTS